MRRTLIPLLACFAWTACAHPTGPAATAPASPSSVAEGSVAWATLSADTFARARAERRIVLIDGSAEWCHWCHVMDATTYRDPEVRKLLAARFLPVKVDIDARPDFEERYHDWGWPATVLMTPEAEEIGKYKGYMPPARLLEILQAASSTSARGEGTAKTTAAQARPSTEGELADVATATQRALDGLWDSKEGSWEDVQKVLLY